MAEVSVLDVVGVLTCGYYDHTSKTGRSGGSDGTKRFLNQSMYVTTVIHQLSVTVYLVPRGPPFVESAITYLPVYTMYAYIVYTGKYVMADSTNGGPLGTRYTVTDNWWMTVVTYIDWFSHMKPSATMVAEGFLWLMHTLAW